jgi:hypothetical protein
MKQFLLYILSFILGLPSFAQGDPTTFIIEDAIQSRKGISRIVYMDSSFNYYGPIRRIANRGRIKGLRDTTKVVLRLSDREIKSLEVALKKEKRIAWLTNMFENSIMIKEDSIRSLFNPNKGRAYFEKHFAKKYFYFSKPVFIRNKPIAIFRVAEMYGPTAGNDLLYFYQKTAGNWKQYMVVQLGAW